MIDQGPGVFTVCPGLIIAALQPSADPWLAVWLVATPDGRSPSNPIKGAYPQRAGTLAIDPPRVLEPWARACRSITLGWINERPIRSTTDMSRSMVPSPRPAAAATTCHSNPSRPGAINDIDQPSHLMIKSMSGFPSGQACPGRAIHNMDING
jgi:hypothetical protein